MTVALYAGSFDPIHKGHINIIHKAITLFDKIVVAVLTNPNKKTLFTMEERVELIDGYFSCVSKKVQVISSLEPLVDVARMYHANVIIKGVRNSADFETEKTQARFNKELSGFQFETIMLIPDSNCEHISSSAIKQIAKLGLRFEPYVTESVSLAIYDKIDRGCI